MKNLSSIQQQCTSTNRDYHKDELEEEEEEELSHLRLQTKFIEAVGRGLGKTEVDNTGKPSNSYIT